MGFARCICNTNAKLAIKQRDKPVTVCQELFLKKQIKRRNNKAEKLKQF